MHNYVVSCKLDKSIMIWLDIIMHRASSHGDKVATWPCSQPAPHYFVTQMIPCQLNDMIVLYIIIIATSVNQPISFIMLTSHACMHMHAMQHVDAVKTSDWDLLLEARNSYCLWNEIQDITICLSRSISSTAIALWLIHTIHNRQNNCKNPL